MERGKPLISGGNRAMSAPLQVQEKVGNDVGREVVDYELVDLYLALRSDKWQEQTESISVALLRVPRYAALMNQMLR
jgi:hypothetical protein